MTRKKSHKPSASEKKKAPHTPQPKSSRALSKQPEAPDTGQPGGGKGRVDVTGVIREKVRVDPYITEGHPGYEESGDSEIVPPESRNDTAQPPR